MAHGLFDVNVFAVVHGGEGYLGVPVIGSGDDDGVQFRVVDHFAPVEGAFGLELGGGGGDPFLVNVADLGDLTLAGLFTQFSEDVSYVVA